jgi:hypothetical protein
MCENGGVSTPEKFFLKLWCFTRLGGMTSIVECHINGDVKDIKRQSAVAFMIQCY